MGRYCNGGAINSGSGDVATGCETIEDVPEISRAGNDPVYEFVIEVAAAQPSVE